MCVLNVVFLHHIQFFMTCNYMMKHKTKRDLRKSKKSLFSKAKVELMKTGGIKNPQQCTSLGFIRWMEINLLLSSICTFHKDIKELQLMRMTILKIDSSGAFSFSIFATCQAFSRTNIREKQFNLADQNRLEATPQLVFLEFYGI